MEKDQYLRKLSTYKSLSPGLKSYLKVTLGEIPFKGSEKICASENTLGGYCYMEKGSARIFLYDEDSEQELTLLFLPSRQMIPDLKLVADHFKGKLFIEFMEESKLLCIPEKHISNIHKLFREAIILSMSISAEAWAKTISTLTDLKLESADKRLDKLLQAFPNIFNVTAVKNVASYLGIHPSTLSAMRTKGNKK